MICSCCIAVVAAEASAILLWTVLSYSRSTNKQQGRQSWDAGDERRSYLGDLLGKLTGRRHDDGTNLTNRMNHFQSQRTT